MAKNIHIRKSGAGNAEPAGVTLLKRTIRMSSSELAAITTPVVKTNGRPLIRLKSARQPRYRIRTGKTEQLSKDQVESFFKTSERYQLIAPIGKGGMAHVFKARDRYLGMDVALKFLPREMLDDNIAIEAFRNEARIAMTLAHKNIVKLHTLEIGAGRIYLVMEYVDGRNFAEIMAKMGRLKPVSVVQIAHSCAAALDYAHGCGVLHKDLKPANLMLTGDSVLKIVDFGIARHVAEAEDDGHEMFLEGTFPYMSPEQFAGHTLDLRTDIYSLAAVFYEFLAGHPILPLSSPQDDLLTVEPMPIEGVSEGLWNVLKKALSKERDQRWASAGEFYAALAAAEGVDISSA